MKRKMEEYLIWWKNLGKEKMPLLLYGARQTGKTYLLQEFGEKYYKNTVYLNFETEINLINLFNDSIDPNKLLPKIEKYFNTKIIPNETLLIFDEIQSCNRALTSLKYFTEQANQYDIIAAGSLLGVHISSKDFSFPVGKVITKTMHPLSFEEFLWESDKSIFIDKIKYCFDKNIPIEESLHINLLELYKDYLIVGGMPLAVYNYFHNDRILNFKEVQKLIIDTYISDMSKYSSSSQSIKTINTYESIVVQLAKDNKKFQYKYIEKGARASLFGESIDWLIRAGVVLKCDKVKRADIPLAIAKDISSFKLYMSDIGLCSYKAGISKDKLNYFDNVFMGGITENYIANTLVYNNYDLYYWESNAQAEVDFLISKDEDIIPLEVKSSNATRSLSLNSYMKKYNPKYAIRISTKNFGFENNIKSVPLYAAYLI